MTDSWALVATAQRGDRDAYAQLYARYAPFVRGYIRWRVHDPQLTKDLAQETFTRGLARLDTLHASDRDVGAWYATIARNLIHDHWKSHHTRRSEPVGTVTESAAEDTVVVDRATQRALNGALQQHTVPSAEDTVVDRATQRTRLRALYAAVGRLTAPQRAAVTEHYLRERTIPDTARVIGRTEGATKALVHRGVRMLRTDPELVRAVVA